MTLKEIIIKLTQEQVLQLTRILLDEDKDGALLFLKGYLKSRLDKANRGQLVRGFET